MLPELLSELQLKKIINMFWPIQNWESCSCGIYKSKMVCFLGAPQSSRVIFVINSTITRSSVLHHRLGKKLRIFQSKIRHHQHQLWWERLPVDSGKLHIFTSSHAGQGDNRKSRFANFWFLLQSWSNLVATQKVLQKLFCLAPCWHLCYAATH